MMSPNLVIAATERVSAPGATLVTDRLVLTPYGKNLLCARPLQETVSVTKPLDKTGPAA